MSGPSAVKETPIESRSQLVEYIASGARTVEKWKIGTEHEKFGFRLDDLRPPTYEGPRGIGALLNGMTRFGWAPVEEHGNVIALTRGDGSITLEPGDIIATGTPPGVGFARKPPVFLQDGDLCEVEIEGLGVLSNPVKQNV